jgi:isochorismate hydrolase
MPEDTQGGPERRDDSLAGVKEEVEMAEVRYDPTMTGLVIIDPVNDFLSEGGKAYPLVKDVLAKVGTVANLKRLLEGARQRCIPLFFAPMAYSEEDYTTWKHLSGIHKAMYDQRMFQAGSWGADFHPKLQPKPGEVIILPHKDIDVFATTDLDTQLRQYAIEYAVFAGMSATRGPSSRIHHTPPRTWWAHQPHTSRSRHGLPERWSPRWPSPTVARYPFRTSK